MPLGVPSEYKLNDTGNLGESLVELIPGMTVIRSLKDGKVHDVDLEIEFNGVRYGAEVKTNNRYNMDPYRYRLTGYGRHSLAEIRMAKEAYCKSMGVTPALLGITIDFERSTFDACLLAGEIRTFLGGRNTVIAQDVPFENTNGVSPLAPERSNQARVPNPFQRANETNNPEWKKRVIYRESPNPEDVF